MFHVCNIHKSACISDNNKIEEEEIRKPERRNESLQICVFSMDMHVWHVLVRHDARYMVSPTQTSLSERQRFSVKLIDMWRKKILYKTYPNHMRNWPLDHYGGRGLILISY